jgi:NAD(P)-dependent dehydrogenase (short-subunit alcohol dehydrogenase family)
MATRWTQADIGDQRGRTAVITGANSGIGLETARALVQHGASVVVACRNPAKAEAARDTLESSRSDSDVSVLELDLADLASVRRAAAAFTAGHDRLDLLVNNAGVMAVPKRTTVDGFESQIGTNHLGHVLLTSLLLGPLLATEGSRVVTVSSNAHRMGRIDLDDLQSTRRYSAWEAYGQSKLANLLFTFELQRRLAAAGASTVAVAAHPGWARSNLAHDLAGIQQSLFRLAKPLADLTAQSPAMGALPTLRAAVDPTARGGDYFGPDGVMEWRGHPHKVGTSAKATDLATARRLWDASNRLTGATWEALDKG